MTEFPRPVAIVAIALAAVPAAAQPGGTITSPFPQPLATYQIIGSPTSETDEFNPFRTYLITGPGAGVNQLTYNWWFYRVQGDPIQRPFGNYAKSDGFALTGTSSWPHNGDGNSATYTWTDFAAAGPRFIATQTLTLTAGPTINDAKLAQSMQIINPGSVPLTVSIFELAAPYPGSSVGLYSASGGITAMSVTSNGHQDTLAATGATGYQAGTDDALVNLLFGGPAGDLNNTGLPVVNFDPNPTGHLIGLAYEWTATVPASGSVTFGSTITAGLPEPNSLVLGAAAVAVAGAAARFRRRA